MVASESMIFVFEFISKPFAYSPKGIFFSTFFHSSSLVDGTFCRTAPLTAANRVASFKNLSSLPWPLKETLSKGFTKEHDGG